jgi:hypothetical protein
LSWSTGDIHSLCLPADKRSVDILSRNFHFDALTHAMVSYAASRLWRKRLGPSLPVVTEAGVLAVGFLAGDHDRIDGGPDKCLVHVWKTAERVLTISKSMWPYRFDSVCSIKSQSILIASSFLRTVVCVADSISLTLPSFSKCRMMIDWMSARL